MPQRRRLRGGGNIRRFFYMATLLVNLQLLATSYLQAHSVYHLLKSAWHKWLSPRTCSHKWLNLHSALLEQPQWWSYEGFLRL
ncbi:predicted protein [Arabidopsis lyrata subsp. lyrata]|uniref:Predicted protein n=1 Tax=Arabidopsis lyrata subsp. lyrata TaxID=81972 RepID=D7L5X3_ARALL|nr:predicted protein [Arabidopsis lyrata subsp. lyrata]